MMGLRLASLALSAHMPICGAIRDRMFSVGVVTGADGLNMSQGGLIGVLGACGRALLQAGLTLLVFPRGPQEGRGCCMRRRLNGMRGA